MRALILPMPSSFTSGRSSVLTPFSMRSLIVSRSVSTFLGTPNSCASSWVA